MSSLEVVATVPVTVHGPDLHRERPQPVHRLGLNKPLLWETRQLEVLWELEQAGPPLSVHHPDATIRAALRDASGRGRVLSGSLDLESRVGFLDLEFRRGGSVVVSVETLLWSLAPTAISAIPFEVWGWPPKG